MVTNPNTNLNVFFFIVYKIDSLANLEFIF